MSLENRPEQGISVGEFKDKHNPDEKIRHLKSLLTKKEAEFENYQKEVGGLRVLFENIRESIEAIDPPKITYKPPRVTRSSAPVTHVCQWTDWHLGAVQPPTEVEDMNEFSPTILAEYIRNCTQNQLEWVELHRKSYDINVCHNLCTGDYISGGIHQELLVTNAFPEPVQCIKAGDLLAEIIAMQSPNFEKVIVDFITVDNHARLTKKPQGTEAGINTWNYVVGWYAKEKLRKFKNVEFNIYEGIHKVVNCGGRRYLLTHGDRIKGWAGFPYYGIERLVWRESAKRIRHARRQEMEGEVDIPVGVKDHLFDRVVMGHWHAPLWHPWYCIGGSAQGTTAYDHGQGRYSEPIQCSWLNTPKYEFDRTDWLLRRDS